MTLFDDPSDSRPPRSDRPRPDDALPRAWQRESLRTWRDDALRRSVRELRHALHTMSSVSALNRGPTSRRLQRRLRRRLQAVQEERARRREAQQQRPL